MKKEIKLIAVVNGIKIDSDTVKNEIIGTLGANPLVQYGVNEYGASTTEINPLTVAEAESVLEWCAENEYNVEFDIGY